MFPLGSYERFVQEVKKREEPDIPVTFGLLIADYRQQKSREYILNYIERFHNVSSNYINFYLPGYMNNPSIKNKNYIKINENEFCFDEKFYMKFLKKLENDFEISYPYNPVLFLMEYSSGNFRFAKKIRIELDSQGSDIQRTGELFDAIFKISKKKVAIEDFSDSLVKENMKKSLLDTVVSGIGNSFLSAAYEQGRANYIYKIK